MTYKLTFDANSPEELKNHVFDMANAWSVGAPATTAPVEPEEKPKKGRKPAAAKKAEPEPTVDATDPEPADAPNEPEAKDEPTIGYEDLLGKMSDYVQKACAGDRDKGPDEYKKVRMACFRGLLAEVNPDAGGLKDIGPEHYPALSKLVDAKMAELEG